MLSFNVSTMELWKQNLGYPSESARRDKKQKIKRMAGSKYEQISERNAQSSQNY